MSETLQIKPGERDPNMPRGLTLVIVAALVLGAFMYILFPGHGPIRGHAKAPTAAAGQG